MTKIEDDPEFKALVKSISFPDIERIAAFARKSGVTNSPEFWGLFDKVAREWRGKRDCTSIGEIY